MSYRKRKIPVLLISNRKLVKTVQFKAPNYLGDPINAVRIFSTKNADEILICDISRTQEGKPIAFDFLREVTEEAMVPVSYIGGVTSIEDCQQLIGLGFEKVGVDAHSWRDGGELLRAAVDMFGASTIIAGCTTRRFLGKYVAVESGKLGSLFGRQPLAERVAFLESLGVGEIFINNIGGDGTFNGIAGDLLESIPTNCKCNIIVCGGVRDFNEIDELLKLDQIDAVAAGSVFVYDGPSRGIMIDYPKRKPVS